VGSLAGLAENKAKWILVVDYRGACGPVAGCGEAAGTNCRGAALAWIWGLLGGEALDEWEEILG
jgi:hypothetical protein